LSKIKLAPWQLSLAAATFIVVTSNSALFSALGQSLDFFSVDGLALFLTIVLLMIFLLNTVFLIFGVGRLQKPLIAAFLVATAILGYFSNEMGVVFDQPMIQNVAETIRDRNSAEAFELASLPLIGHVLLFGVVPLLLLAFIEIEPRHFAHEIAVRALVVFTGLALVTGVTLPTYKNVTYFASEHRDLRFKITPIFPMLSILGAVRDSLHRQLPFRVIDADAIQVRSSARRTIGIMVVGETARADHFSLDGYARKTNPQLEATDGVLFVQATSCGTSTFYSVPCMFSMRGRDTYTASTVTTESNVLDILTSAGVQTTWIDNNSSCKKVCNRIESVNLRHNPDESSPLYSDMGYFDEVLLESIDTYLGSEGSDLLIVLHTLGSHGPAYSRRYPPEFSVFAPSCDRPSPTECPDNAVANAYDNTILYTDHVLSMLIRRLKASANDFDAFLFYASDHGESLGENGVYLHGLPYAIAPAAQTDVPFVIWLSPGFKESRGIGEQAVDRSVYNVLSHDNISHTLLGFFDVQALSYDPGLDIFARSRLAIGPRAGQWGQSDAVVAAQSDRRTRQLPVFIPMAKAR
jgi:lipid A ethanolaminephosphotransferase